MLCYVSWHEIFLDFQLLLQLNALDVVFFGLLIYFHHRAYLLYCFIADGDDD